MHRIRYIHQPQDNPAVRRRAIIASFAFHGVALTALLLITLYYAAHFQVLSGSAAGAPTMTLEPMVVVSTPAEPPPPSPQVPIPMPPLPPTTVPTPLTPTKVPEIGVPVLPPIPTRTPVAQAKPSQEKTAHGTSNPSPKASGPRVAPTSSDRIAGSSQMAHPGYPPEAISRGESGTVVMLVEFNANGGVARAEVAESSGVPLLDSATRSYIRENWRSPEYAGQSITVPVQYVLTR